MEDICLNKYFSDEYDCEVIEKHYAIYDPNLFYHLLDHEYDGIAKVLAVNEYEEYLAVVEKYIEGANLQEYIKASGTMSYEEVIKIIDDLCNILIPLHNSGIIHRDIKPENIIYDGRNITLIDFNSAKIAKEEENKDTVLLGTAGYAAPEQYGFGSSGIYTDIFGIGMLMKYLLNGSIEDDSYKGPLRTIIDDCTRMDPLDRFSSINDLKSCLPHLHKPYVKGMKVEAREFLPIGFRQGIIRNIFISSIFHSLLFCLSPIFITDRIVLFSFLLAIILIVGFSFNYLHILDRLKIRQDNRKPMIALIIMIDLLVFLTCLTIGFIISNLF